MACFSTVENLPIKMMLRTELVTRRLMCSEGAGVSDMVVLEAPMRNKIRSVWVLWIQEAHVLNEKFNGNEDIGRNCE